MKRELNIVVSGRAGSGKTTVARVIADALEALGIDVDMVPEPDGDDSRELCATRLPVILSDGLKVTVATRHVPALPPLLTPEK